MAKNLCHFCYKANNDVLLCGRCSLVKYCSKKCQKKDWGVHKLSCIPKPQKATEKSNKNMQKILHNQGFLTLTRSYSYHIALQDTNTVANLLYCTIIPGIDDFVCDIVKATVNPNINNKVAPKESVKIFIILHDVIQISNILTYPSHYCKEEYENNKELFTFDSFPSPLRLIIGDNHLCKIDLGGQVININSCMM